MIRVLGLRKHYKVHERPPGVAAAFRSLFHREYKTVAAVDGIDFAIEPGERVGFLGPNGAGKTTTLKLLAGLLHPTSGEVSVDGHEPRRREDAYLKKIMLVLGQKQQLLWDLPPSETFELNRAVYDVPRPQFVETMRELSQLLELGDLVKRPTRTLSLGERMKCELAAALVHRPRVLFLDEPTIGLDVSMQATVRGFVHRYNERYGATLILTSHYMEDVQRLCPRVIVIDKGKLVYDGALDELVTRIRPDKRVILRFSRPVEESDVASLGTIVRDVDGSGGGGETKPGAPSWSIALDVHMDAVNRVVTEALSRLPVRDLTVETPPLEEVMSELFARGEGHVTRLGSTLRAFPTLLRIGFMDAVAYRAELLVWMLATTMPLVMLALFTTVAAGGPIGRYGQPEFIAYFLATFIVRQLTGSWAFYEMNFEVRNGTLAMRLLRPVHPLWAYAAENLAALPMRFLVSIPVAAIALVWVGGHATTHDPVMWMLFAVSTLGSWLITLFVNFIVGCLSFWVESSMKLMDTWLVFFFVLSGYLIPVDLFPHGARAVIDWLPFRYQIGLPVELMTGAHGTAHALTLLGRQWMWVAIGLGTTSVLWRRGLRRFAAYGG